MCSAPYPGAAAELDVEIKIKILGPPELRAAGPQGVTVSSQLWCVLVSLLIAPNRPVTADALIDRLWDDHPPAKAGTTIRSYIWRIDRVLSQMPGEVAHISRQAHGYALDIDPDVIDLHRFRSLKKQSDALTDSGEVHQAAELLREAEVIWRGQALDGLPGDWIGRQRDTIEEEHRIATVCRIELELMLGRHSALLAELAGQCELHPLDETLAAHRITALFRCGRQADALRVYRDTRAKLVAEGVEPTPELAQLHLRILHHDPELAITPAYRRPDRKPQPNTLPPDIEDFVGRSAEMLLLAGDTDPDSRPALLVITGMGGVGKTALAVHAGHRMTQRYPDAQLYLNFRAHDQLGDPLEPADALRDLLAMLDVPAERIPGSLAERAELWRAELAFRRAVLIFDDVTGPDQVQPLLPAAGNIKIIVTSRQLRPDWSTGQGLTLRVLPEQDAAALFTQVAGHASSREPDQAARVSRLCGYLPLAIRLAASRIRSGAVTSAPDLLDELAELTGGPGGEIGHRLQAAFELSYRRLAPSEQRYFRYVGISPCLDTTIVSGAVLTGVTLTESRTALNALSSHHLLEETSPGRFGCHDLIRAFAATRFADEDAALERGRGISRLADYYLRAVRRASDLSHAHRGGTPSADEENQPQSPEAATAWLESEWGNALRVAEHCARRGFKRLCADLIHALGDFLNTSGHWDDARAAHLIALQAYRGLDDLSGIGRSAFDLSFICMRTGRSEEALEYATDAARTFKILGDRPGRAGALDLIGVIHRNTARFRGALAYHLEALDIYREVGDWRGLARTLVHAGTTLWYLGRLGEEMNYLSRALDIFRENGDSRGQAIALNGIGTVHQHQGDYRNAMHSYQLSHDIFYQVGGLQSLAIANHNMARVQQCKGNHAAAITIYREVLATYRSMGDLQHQAYALIDIASVYRSTERHDEALAHYENAAFAADKVGDRYAYAEALCGIAGAHFGSGRLSAALENYERAARLAGEIESLYLKARALSGIADIVLDTEGSEAARIYWREAHDIFAQLGVPEAATVETRLHTLDAPAS
jgi:DNA-binding SARP family transcriptional activator/tetratricopeptide (TPR) repeat protein